jgi:two-component system, cell cycle response regulator
MPGPSPGFEEATRILVVDDDPETANLLRTWFREEPYEIFEARDGREGLSLAVREMPDIILLDLRMPVLDGHEVARGLKANPVTAGIPIILLSVSGLTEDKVEAFAAGADDYVVKPFAFEEVDARIRAMLRKRELYLTLETTARDLRTSNAQLEVLAVEDEMTGLANFRAFKQRLSEEWQRAMRYRHPLSLVFFDLDDFKRLNDTFGHPVGDRALKEFGILVQGGARVTDLAARYGGEEFSMILPHTAGAMAARVAERIRAAVQEYLFVPEDGPARLTVSAGIATYPSHPDVDSAEALVRAADRALYRAKDRGKNRVVVDIGPAIEPE